VLLQSNEKTGEEKMSPHAKYNTHAFSCNSTGKDERVDNFGPTTYYTIEL